MMLYHISLVKNVKNLCELHMNIVCGNVLGAVGRAGGRRQVTLVVVSVLCKHLDVQNNSLKKTTSHEYAHVLWQWASDTFFFFLRVSRTSCGKTLNTKTIGQMSCCEVCVTLLMQHDCVTWELAYKLHTLVSLHIFSQCPDTDIPYWNKLVKSDPIHYSEHTK